MLDRDLADLYRVATSQLKRSVRRNIDRFPEDIMFELTKEELDNWRCQFGTSKMPRPGGLGPSALAVAGSLFEFSRHCLLTRP